MAQMHYVQDHPEALRHMEVFQNCLAGLLEQEAPLFLACREQGLLYRNEPLEGSPHAAQMLAQILEARGIGGLAFHQGLEADDIQLLFFALLLPPHRVLEMGGASILLGDGGHVQILPSLEIPAPENWASDVQEGYAAGVLESLEDTQITAPGPTTPAVLASDLITLFSSILQTASSQPGVGSRSPWSREQRESLSHAGFLHPDFSILAGAGDQLGLGSLDAQTIRASLRIALSSLDPVHQGSIVLGLTSFPCSEQALASALDYLAPELLAQAVADVSLRNRVSMFELALMISAMFEGIKDRVVALEAIRGRMQLEGWSIEDLDSLQEAILWECQGTDTKVRLTLLNKGLFDLDPHQAMTFTRQLVRSKSLDPIRDLVAQLESGFASPEIARRRFAAQVVADLAECVEDPGLPAELGRRLQKALHDHIALDTDEAAVLWSAQGLEALLVHWMHVGDFEGIYQEMMALSEIILLQRGGPGWKSSAVRNLLARLASPLNIAALTPSLHQRENRRALTQLQALLSLMGRPAASYLMACLEVEENRERRTQLLDALKAIGRNAVPALQEALSSPSWFQVRNAVMLLGDLGDDAVFNDVALTLGHRDPRVRRAAMAALSDIGSKDKAAGAIAAQLPQWDLSSQLDALAVLGELRSPAAIPAISEIIRQGKSPQEDNTRVRLRAVEVLGLIGTSEAVDPLRELFKKKGLLGGRESTAVRLSAAKSLAAVNTREAREAIALALDMEPHEDVRSILRQYLVN
ncbi:MAG: HEAT-like repeat-containing protein [Holophagaceae bacterium]|nr:HEAT-like repeat-containing protein [Holophagaceae bacterium]